MRVWDTKTGQCTRILSGHSASVLCLQYDSKILVSGSSDCRVLVWDLVGAEGTGAGKWDIKWSLLGHTMGVLDLCFDDDYIVSCSKVRLDSTRSMTRS
jgi:F-box and WD-40 domain protein 1/11